MKHNFIVREKSNVVDFLVMTMIGLGKTNIKKLLQKREIKVNGKRIMENLDLKEGDRIEIFVPGFLTSSMFHVLYEDSNILIIDKMIHVEIVQLEEYLKRNYEYICAVHRLDANTRGLCIFAKNAESEKILLSIFKEREVTKKYSALIYGVPKEGTHTAYLYKDAKNSFSYVSDNKKEGYKQIITKIEIIKTLQIKDLNINIHKGIIAKECLAEDVYYKSLGVRLDEGDVYNNLDREQNSLDSSKVCFVDLTLVTGRTHQLRAHLSHLGCPIIGDDKYGNYQINKFFGKKVQQLVAKSIEFNLLPVPLDYLNKKKFQIDYDLSNEILKKR